MKRPIGRVLADLAAAAPDAPAVTCAGVTLSRLELERRSNRLARAYEQLGVRSGAFVTIALPNGVEFFVVAFAVWKLGAVPQPVSHRLPQRERDSIIELADPVLVVGVDPDAHPDRACVPAGYEPDPTIRDAPILPDRVSPSWKAPTSGGSTGTPKLIVSADPGEVDPGWVASIGMRADGVVLIPGPMYHNAPFSSSFSGLFNGTHVVLLPKFDAVAALDAIQTYRVEYTNLVPTMMLRMWRVLEPDPSVYDLSSLQRLWHMAAPCPAWLKEKWIELLGGDRVWELYGGTEQQVTTVISGTEWLAHRGSVGRPPRGSMKVVDADGSDLPAGEVGEIFMRGERETYRYIGAEARAVDGWESLGDLGWLDEDGYLYLSDRRTDMIVSGGANIYPAEIEAALVEHPDIESAIVVGLPDDDLGQRAHAVIQAPTSLPTDEVVSFLADRLVRYKIPRSFRVVAEPLRDDAGKARRSAIRDDEIARSNRVTP